MDDSNRLFQEISPCQLRRIFAETLGEPRVRQFRLLEACTPFGKYGDRSPCDNSTQCIRELLAELDSL